MRYTPRIRRFVLAALLFSLAGIFSPAEASGPCQITINNGINCQVEICIGGTCQFFLPGTTVLSNNACPVKGIVEIPLCTGDTLRLKEGDWQTGVSISRFCCCDIRLTQTGTNTYVIDIRPPTAPCHSC